MNELLAQGLQLMGVGMLVVFLFLGLLIATISLISSVIQKFEAKVLDVTNEPLNNDDLRIVISEAVQRYRKNH